MKKTGIIILFLLSFFASISAQVQRCGYPNYMPKTGENHFFIDTCGKAFYEFKRPKWYFIGRIIANTAPQIEFPNGTITINNSEAEWYNPINGRFWRCNGTAWVNNDNVNIDSLVNVHFVQTITGKKTFSDTLTASKGINSNGIIGTKGVKSDGSATVAAVNANGVQKSATVTITANTTLDGTYNTIYANTSSGNITITLPSITTNNTGWSYTIMKTASTNTLFIARPSSSTITIVSNNYSVTIKNSGISWEIQ